jgi:metallo-beta-lactamase family protein
MISKEEKSPGACRRHGEGEKSRKTPMKISFLGAARTVTGTQHLITINEKTILLDCGLYQGSPQEARERNSTFDFDPAQLDAVILTHAHTDHCGNLPNLIKQGYSGPIYSTPVTAHLADLLMRDSGKIQELEAEDEDLEEEGGCEDEYCGPLYTREEAAQVKQYFMPTFYNTPFDVVDGVRGTLINAGHILGSAAVRLEVEETGGKKHAVWFSGDIGRRNLPLIRDPELPSDVDTLIMESTYGDKSHGDPLAAYEQLREVIINTVERGGRLIIPAFAVGRTQEIVYNIHQMFERGEAPEVPVYVDSPLAAEASKVFTGHPEYLDDEARNFLRESGSFTALGFDMLTYIQSARESRELNHQNGPMVVISTSGMLEAGRVLHHLKFSIGDPRNTVLLVSYQAPGTLGRALAEGAQQVRIMGRTYERKAEVCVISGLSAHAGQDFLMEYAGAVKDQAKQVFLVHAEEQAAGAFQEKLKVMGMEKVYYPYMRQTMEL